MNTKTKQNNLKAVQEKTAQWEKEFLENTVLPIYTKIGKYCDENNLDDLRDVFNNLLIESYNLGRTEIQAFRDLKRTVKNNPKTFNDKTIRRLINPTLPY